MRIAVISLAVIGSHATSDDVSLLQSKSEGTGPFYSQKAFPGGRDRITSPRASSSGGAPVCGFGHTSMNPGRSQQFYECDWPLPFGISDMRGEWQGWRNLGSLQGQRLHVERIEQCYDRVTISTVKGVRDWPHADGTAEYGAMDYDQNVMPDCIAYTAAGKFDAAGCFVIIVNEAATNEGSETRCAMADGSIRVKIGESEAFIMSRVGGPTNYGFPVRDHSMKTKSDNGAGQ